MEGKKLVYKSSDVIRQDNIKDYVLRPSADCEPCIVYIKAGSMQPYDGNNVT